LPDVQAAFADPARRCEGKRHLDSESYAPPLSSLRARFPANFPLGVKIAPGVALDRIAGLDAEIEFVSLDGELKECVLWFGPLRTTGRRATVLPSGRSIYAEEPRSMPQVVSVREYVFDLDPAVVRAGLAGHLASELGSSPIDSTVALLTAEKPLPSPFLTTYCVEASGRLHLGRLREQLRTRGVGRITIVKRGSKIDADELSRKLKLAGSEHRVVLLTRAAGEQVMIVCERVTAASA
jgi:hypothetical protein